MPMRHVEDVVNTFEAWASGSYVGSEFDSEKAEADALVHPRA